MRPRRVRSWPAWSISTSSGPARWRARTAAAQPRSWPSCCPELDVASVVVPTEAHAEVVQACLEAGVHTLVEKPITRTLEEADALIALARSRALTLAVGHLERF